MSKLFKCTRLLVALCVLFMIVYGVLLCLPSSIDTRVNDHVQSKPKSLSSPKILSGMRNFTDEEISKMSVLGKRLWSIEEASPLRDISSRKDPFLILIWKHGGFLERRHIRRFTNKKYSPWEGCSVKNCLLSYESEDLQKASAVVFHLHLTKNANNLPQRTRQDQRWIFLTDESPLHTFLYGNQRLSDYNGLFNWSMSYRADSDIPVPYGRTTRIISDSSDQFSPSFLMSEKTKSAAIMGSNCGVNNGRWNYVSDLKKVLGNELDVYGRCLNGNKTACPGHFDKDCDVLNAYKFYLAFENSNCREYMTEKVFWHGYKKMAVPIIMGPPRKDCERLLPPHSFLHVDDFANPAALANYIKYLDRHDEEYLKYHQWRDYFTVINEHGYFGSASRHYCRICEALHYNSPGKKIYDDLQKFWSKEKDCFPT